MAWNLGEDMIWRMKLRWALSSAKSVVEMPPDLVNTIYLKLPRVLCFKIWVLPNMQYLMQNTWRCPNYFAPNFQHWWESTSVDDLESCMEWRRWPMHYRGWWGSTKLLVSWRMVQVPFAFCFLCSSTSNSSLDWSEVCHLSTFCSNRTGKSPMATPSLWPHYHHLASYNQMEKGQIGYLWGWNSLSKLE